MEISRFCTTENANLLIDNYKYNSIYNMSVFLDSTYSLFIIICLIDIRTRIIFCSICHQIR